MLQIFQFVDAEGNGSLDIDDLMPFLSLNGIKMTKQQLQETITAWDSRGLMSLSYSDFCLMCRNDHGFKQCLAELQAREDHESKEREATRQKRRCAKLLEAEQAKQAAAQKRAATKLQAFWRGVKARAYVRELRELKEKRKAAMPNVNLRE